MVFTSVSLLNTNDDTLFFARMQEHGSTTVLIVSFAEASPEVRSARSLLFVWYSELAASAMVYASAAPRTATSIIWRMLQEPR